MHATGRDVIAFRTNRRLLDELAGTKRGAHARMLRKLLSEEAQRRGLVAEGVVLTPKTVTKSDTRAGENGLH